MAKHAEKHFSLLSFVCILLSVIRSFSLLLTLYLYFIINYSGGMLMLAKETLHKEIDTLPDEYAGELLDFVNYLKRKKLTCIFIRQRINFLM